MDLNRPGIYKITCTANGMIYIGSAANVRMRWAGHRCNLRKNDARNPRLQRAWNRHGEECFTFEVIEWVEFKDDLITREQYWLDLLEPWRRDVGFNVLRAAENCLGFKHSEDTRRRMSESRLGKKQGSRSQETRKAISEAKKRYFQTDEGKAHQQEMQRRRFAAPESRAEHGKKVGEIMKRRLESDEAKAAHAEAGRRGWASAELRAKQADKVRRRFESEEARAENAERIRKAWACPERRARKSEAMKLFHRKRKEAEDGHD